MSTHGPKLIGSVGVASPAMMVTSWPSKQTVWYNRDPPLMILNLKVLPAVTVMFSWLQPGLPGDAQGCWTDLPATRGVFGQGENNEAWAFDHKGLLHGKAFSAALHQFWVCLVVLKAAISTTVIFVPLRWYRFIETEETYFRALALLEVGVAKL